MNSRDYWAERARLDKIKVINTGEQGIDNLKRLLRTNLDDVEKKIKDFYEKYGENPAEKLSYDEFEKYKRELAKKAKKYPKDKTLQKLAKQDIPKYKIDRLRALQTDIQIALTEATAGQEAGIYKTLEDVGKVAQETLAKRFTQTLGLEFNTIASRKMKQLLSSDWSGASWNTRLWNDREVVGEKLTNILEKGVTQGTSLQKMSRELKQATGQSFNNAFRLIRTETSHIDGQVTLEGYKQAKEELGLEYYEYDAFLDSRTSKICRELDKKRFRIDEAKVGVNYPPMHPNCRSTTQMVLDEDYKGEDKPKAEEKLKEKGKGKTKETTSKREDKPVLVEKGTQKKGSAIPQNKSTEFVKAKTTEEANKYAESLGISKAEYKGLDLETANRMNKVYAEYSKKYPEIIKNMEYTGSMQNLTKNAKDNIFTRDFCLKQLKKSNPNFDFSKLSTKQLEKYIVKQQNHYIKLTGYQVNTTARAISRYDKYYKGVTFNAKEKYKDTIKNRALEVAKKYKPMGTASVEGTIHHELGHQLDYLLKLRENKEIQNIYLSLSNDEITQNLSIYAWNNTNKNQYAEFIAEAWSEYNTSRKPRKIAKQVGTIIEKEYKKFKN